jgi:hypothetical protein
MILNFRIIDAAPVDELRLVCFLWRTFLEDYTGQEKAQWRIRHNNENYGFCKVTY